MPRFAIACSVLLWGGFASPIWAEEWSRFRGPNGSGIVAAAPIPQSWTEKELNWKVTLPGLGHSSPVVWGEKIFITAGENKSGKRIVHCVDLKKGTTLWTRTYEAAAYRTHKRNSIATSTPAVDEKRLYLCWATPEQLTVQALDHEGKEVWKKDLGAYKSQHGFGVSPIRFADVLILPNDQDDGGSLVALDVKDGSTRWVVPRKPKNATYSTPCVYEPAKGEPQIIFTNWQHGITSVNPKNGKVNWEISVFNTKTQERAVSSPIIIDDLILGTCGFVTGQKHHVAVRVENGKPKEVWRVERQVSYMPTPIAIKDRVFLCSEQGWATCLDAKTGKEIWQERIGGSFSASPVAVGDRIYCIADDGIVHVLKAADSFERLARFELGDKTQATPAIAAGRMIIRTEKYLICVGGKPD